MTRLNATKISSCNHWLVRIGAVSVCCAGLSTAVAAHAFLDRGKALPNATYEGVLVIPHGCDMKGQLKPTIKIQVRVPMDLTEIEVPGDGDWKATVSKLPNGFSEIVWEGGKLAPEAALSLKLKAKVADLPNGRVLYLPTVQSCEGGATNNWIDIPEAGKSDSTVESPAPQLTISREQPKSDSSSGGGGHHHH